jgi:RNA polymerase sigma-70 factor, ECF subfamily
LRADVSTGGLPKQRARATAARVRHVARSPIEREDDVSDSMLLAVARGDARAVRDCMDRYSGLVWSIARRMSPNETDAEDAVQEIFIDLWKSAHRFDPEKSAEKTFIVMIARRRLIDRLRRFKRLPEMDSLDHENAPEIGINAHERMERDAEAQMAVDALELLRPEQRRLVELSVLKGLPHAEIAATTGIPLGTVKSHIRRGLIALREALDLPPVQAPDRTGGRSTASGEVQS